MIDFDLAFLYKKLKKIFFLSFLYKVQQMLI